MESKSHIHAQLMYRIEKQKMKNLHNGGTHNTHIHCTLWFKVVFFRFILLFFFFNLRFLFVCSAHIHTHTHTNKQTHIRYAPGTHTNASHIIHTACFAIYRIGYMIRWRQPPFCALHIYVYNTYYVRHNGAARASAKKPMCPMPNSTHIRMRSCGVERENKRWDEPRQKKRAKPN